MTDTKKVNLENTILVHDINPPKRWFEAPRPTFERRFIRFDQELSR